jgi:hypothetical protein
MDHILSENLSTPESLKYMFKQPWSSSSYHGEEKVALKKALMPTLQRWKKHLLKGFVGKYNIIFLQKRISIYVGWGGKWFQISIIHKLLLPWGVYFTHTHTHLYFFGTILCDFAPFLQNLGFFLCQQFNDLLGKKRPKSPPKKVLIYLYMGQVSSQKYIYGCSIFSFLFLIARLG